MTTNYSLHERFSLVIVCFLFAITANFVAVSTSELPVSWLLQLAFYGVFLINMIILLLWQRFSFCIAVFESGFVMVLMTWGLLGGDLQLVNFGMGLFVSCLFQIVIQTHRNSY